MITRVKFTLILGVVLLILVMMFYLKQNSQMALQHEEVIKEKKPVIATIKTKALDSPTRTFESYFNNHYMNFICGLDAWQAKYEQFHKESIEKLKKGETDSLNFLVYQCHSNCGGLFTFILININHD